MTESAQVSIARKKRELLARPVRAKGIGRQGKLVWKREAVTSRVQSDYPQEVFLIEGVRLMEVMNERLRSGGAQPGDIEYRFGYYIVSRSGKWWWGQYRPSIPRRTSIRCCIKQKRRGPSDEIRAQGAPLMASAWRLAGGCQPCSTERQHRRFPGRGASGRLRRRPVVRVTQRRRYRRLATRPIDAAREPRRAEDGARRSRVWQASAGYHG